MSIGPPPAILFLFAAAFAVAAFINIRYAEQVKRWRDDHFVFEFQRRINRTVAISTYRAGGWIFAVCSVVMFVMAIGKTLGV